MDLLPTSLPYRHTTATTESLPAFLRRPLSFALTVVLLIAFSAAASADPPAGVARLGYMSGSISFAAAGEDEWDQAAVNRPLSPGDRLWADAGGRAELQLPGAVLRLSDSTAITLLNLDDNITQVQLSEGSLNVRVRRLEPDQVVEVDTPHLAFTLREPGAYRIDVDAEGQATTVRMRQGQGEVTGEGGSYWLEAPQVQRFTGEAQIDEGYASAPPPDEFDGWTAERDRVAEASVSARYVSPDVVGYQDLDDNGSWDSDPGYGHVWYPRRVAAGWAPYRDGHWAWIDPWGWTWVDDAPWGYTVSHYGRWAHIRGRWAWVPGPVRSRAYYAPALVVFVGGGDLRLKIKVGGNSGVGWFPLGPREVYRPAYKASPTYVERVNVSNTVVNKTVIKNVYVTKVTNITYVNRRVPGAVVAVPQDSFRSSQPVAKVAVKATKEMVESRESVAAAPVVPTEKSVRGNTAEGRKPPPRVIARQVVARTAPPPAKPSFAAQQARLAAQPGKPLDDEQRAEVRKAQPASPPQQAASAPAVKVVAKPSSEVKKLPARSAKATEPASVTRPGAGASSAATGAPTPPAAAERAASGPKRGDKKAERAARAASGASSPAAAPPVGAASAPTGATRKPPRRPPGAASGASTGASSAAGTSADAAPATPSAAASDARREERRAAKRAAAQGAAASAPATSESRAAARAEQRAAKQREAARKRAEEAGDSATAPPHEPASAASQPRRKKPQGE